MENLPEGFTLDTPGLPEGFKLDEPTVAKPPVEEKERFPLLREAADVPLSFGRGLIGGIQMISDAFGAGSSASNALSSADTYLADLMSAQSKKDSQEIARIMKDAQDKGMLEQVKAGLKALSVAPVDLVTNALGTAAPAVVAGLAATMAAPAVATAAGASAATAAAIGTGAGVAAELGVGAVTGAGTIKNRIYSDVKQVLLDKGVAEDKAEAAAQEAQSYNGKNLDNILLGALFGAGASVTGVERTGLKTLASKILKNAAETATEQTVKEVGESAAQRFMSGAVKEAIPEAAQEAQEQVASNIAQQREGEEVPTFRGAAGAATLAGVTGAVLGGGLDVATGKPKERLHPIDEDQTLLDAFKTIGDFSKPENYLRLAEKHRDNIPVLGQILDSGISEDKKIQLIMNRIGEIDLAEAGVLPSTGIQATGPRSLAPPQGVRPTRLGVSEFYNAALDSDVDLKGLSIDQSPSGFRITNQEKEVVADGINNQKDANILLEALNRSTDQDNIKIFREELKAYDTRLKQVEAEAMTAAAREVKEPYRPIPMSEIQGQISKGDEHIIPMIQIRRNRTGQDMEAPVTIEELRDAGASKNLLDAVMSEQKPYTYGTQGTIRPEAIEREMGGPRPLEPATTAKTEEQLAAIKVPEVEYARGRTKGKGIIEGKIAEQEAPSEPKKVPPPVYPKFEDVQKARALVEDRIGRIENMGDQGKEIGRSLREAIDKKEFTPEQLTHAFGMADVSAKLLGKTAGDIHTFKFVDRLMTPAGEEVRGSRQAATENLRGLVQLSLSPESLKIGRSTSAHEAFHVLQDMFRDSDQAASNIIQRAFKGAKSFDDIDPLLLNKLKTMKDPDSGKSVYDTLKGSVTQDILDGYEQAQREREMQAYVFGSMDDAVRRGNESMSGLGSAYRRFMNYYRNFISRIGNFLRGQGYNSVDDVFKQTIAGERQAGKKIETKEDKIDYSRAAQQTGENEEEFKKWWGDSKAVDENGQPARWYSGTHSLDEKGKPFKAFGEARSGAIPGKTGPFFFSRNPDFASEFATRNLSKKTTVTGREANAGRVMPVFLSAQNPFDYENNSHVEKILKDPDVRYSVDRGMIFPSFLKEGMWQTIERGVIQNAIRKNGFDGFYIKEALDKTTKDEQGNVKFLPGKLEEKNLAVFDPKQVKGVFNTFEKGTAEAAEFSRAIAATGQEKEAEVNSRRFKTIWDNLREFFYPFALVENLNELFKFRNVYMGSVANAEEYARKMSDIIAKGSPEERASVYKYMTTRGADPSTIANEKIRDAAVQSKKEINRLAKEMISRGELTEESFNKYYDRYLPRLYLYFLMTKGGLKTPMNGRSVQEYLKERNEDLTPEERAVLGEVKDPAFLVYVGLSRPARDMAVTDYLDNIIKYGSDPKNAWVEPSAFVEWKGKKVTPYFLETKAQDLLEVAKKLEQMQDNQSVAMKKEALEMLELALETKKQIGGNIDNYKSAGYKQMPQDRRYGNLSGAIVKEGIYNDLVGTFLPISKRDMSVAERLFGDENSAIVRWTQLWKLGKTTLNPPTQFTNAFSNAVALNLFGGVPLHQFPSLFKTALQEMINDGAMYKDAKAFGIGGGTMVSAELRAAMNRLLAYQGKAGNDTSVVGMFASTRAIMSAFAEKASGLYQLSEVLFKLMKYIHDVKKAGPNPSDQVKSDAVTAAHDALFDYTLVNPNIRYLRQAPIGLPFITYYYKALPKLVETAVKTPWRFLPYITMAYALPLAVMSAFDLDEDELEKFRKSAADYIRDNGSLYFLPMRDSKGNIQFIDASRFFPFSSFTDPMITAFKYGEYKKAAKDLFQPFTPSGPAVTAITALNSGTDPFTQKKIYDDRDTPKAQALSIMSYIWNQALPPALNLDLNNPDHSAGALPRIYNSLFSDGTGVDKRGMPKPEVIESIGRLFGINVTPLDAVKQRASNILYMQNQINKTKALMTQTGRDQSLTPEDRRSKIRELADKIKQDTLELQQYAAETSGVERAAKKVKQSQ